MSDKHKQKQKRHGRRSRISTASTIFRKQRPKVGARPGAMVFGDAALEPRIRAISYSKGKDRPVKDETIADMDGLIKSVEPDSITWIDVQGFGDGTLVKKIGKHFGIHPLALADIVNVPQRPKAEVYGEESLIITRMVRIDEAGQVQMEQVGVLLSSNYVLTIQEHYGDILDPLRSRIHSANSRIRKHGSDYLMYAIVDTIIDGYYPVIDDLGDHLEELEEIVMTDPSTDSLRKLNQTKNLLVNIRRVIWPQREAINSMIREETSFVSEEVRLYLRDTYDHCVQAAEVVEMYREMATGLINIYLSAVANRSNDVMKVLTIMASIFIPLTFMAGIYGMNFDEMPELHYKWSYPLLWVAMLLVAGGMVGYFWRKGWIFSGSRD